MKHLADYLNDHLAGSVAALELLDRLIDTYEDAGEKFFRTLRAEIESEQDILKALIQKLGEKESPARKAGAWIMEKLSRSKIRLGDPDVDQMGLFLALEGLVVGITGKEALWRALAVVSAGIPALAAVDYDQLLNRAIGQRERVEKKRQELAKAVLVQA